MKPFRAGTMAGAVRSSARSGIGLRGVGYHHDKNGALL